MARNLAEIDVDMDALRSQKESIMAQLRVLARERDVAYELDARQREEERRAAGRGVTVIGE